MAYEHTALHLETILYMLVQSGTFVPPVGVARPVAKVAELETPQPSAIFKVEGGALKRGLQKGVIGWDNESPEIAVTVAPFEVQERPVTNIEYLEFLDSVLPADWRTAEVLDPLVPASWEVAEGEVLIKTALGRLPILVGQHWPVFTSLTHAQAYAESRGMRLPTENEVALLLELEAQNGSQASANVGFVKFHPDDVVQGSGLRHVLGHGWEWSTTEFAPFDGFQIDPMYVSRARAFLHFLTLYTR